MHASTVPHTTYCCSSCARMFLVAGEVGEEALRCDCGASLLVHEVPRGVYELDRVEGREAACRPSDAEMAAPAEPDIGYGRSHGYGPAHGGPTGPGDAPATE